jgi:hypothetical protein
MPTSKKSCPSAANVTNPAANPSSGLADFSKAILLLSNKQEGFCKAVESLNQFVEEIRTDLRSDIQSQWIENENLKMAVETERKNLRIETEQQIKEFGYEAAKKILRERGEVPMCQEEVDTMKARIHTLETTMQDSVQKELNEEKTRSKVAIQVATTHANLKHTAETADIRARVEQQKMTIDNHLQTIENLQKDVAAQRQLTKEVAIAGRQGAISQTIGKQ